MNKEAYPLRVSALMQVFLFIFSTPLIIIQELIWEWKWLAFAILWLEVAKIEIQEEWSTSVS